MIRWTGPAIRDVEQAWDFIAADNPVAADRVVESLVRAVERLEQFPLSGRVSLGSCRELTVPRIPYRIVYRIADHEIQILRLIHAKRNWPKRT